MFTDQGTLTVDHEERCNIPEKSSFDMVISSVYVPRPYMLQRGVVYVTKL